MPRGDWRILATLVGCLAVAGLGLTDTEERRYNEQRTNSARQQTDQIDRNRAGLPTIAESYISNPDPKDANETERRDLAAQEASAVWAFWVVVVSILGTLITALGTLLLYQQIILTRRAVEDTGEATEAMREANRIAEDNSHRELRAYLSVKSLTLKESDFIEDQYDFRMEIANHGQTPGIVRKIVFSSHWIMKDTTVFTTLVKQSGQQIFECHRDTPVMFPVSFMTPFDGKGDDGHIFTTGKLFYKDVFGKLQVHEFGWQTPPEEFGPFDDINFPVRFHSFSPETLRAAIDNRKGARDAKK